MAQLLERRALQRAAVVPVRHDALEVVRLWRHRAARQTAHSSTTAYVVAHRHLPAAAVFCRFFRFRRLPVVVPLYPRRRRRFIRSLCRVSALRSIRSSSALTLRRRRAAAAPPVARIRSASVRRARRTRVVAQVNIFEGNLSISDISTV